MSVRILHADCREALKHLPDASVHCCVTSPPYYGLRDYGVTGQIGLEATPDEYIAEMVAVFREVRRVLRSDATLWLNLGDSYASGGGSGIQGSRGQRFDRRHTQETLLDARYWPEASIKPKDLIGIPWMLAFALRADGWWLRKDIIWAKLNPMPESATDRPTSSHEHVFLLAKSERYFFDGEAVREGQVSDRPDMATKGVRTGLAYLQQGAVASNSDKQSGHGRRHAGFNERWKAKIKVPGGWDQGEGAHGTVHRDGRTEATYQTADVRAGRNIRDVWTIATAPFPEAHFACVDQETECLTTRGWIRQDDLRVGDRAAQFDLASGSLSWGVVEDVARYDVANQEMVVGQSRDLDMWLTPNHRTIVQRRHPRTRQRQAPTIIRADELLASHSVPTAAPWDFDGDASIPLEWAELLGWYFAEGHESKDSLSVEMYQSESANPEKCERIEALLRQVGAEWTKASCSRQWRGRTTRAAAYRIVGYAAVRLRELAPGKRLPWGVTLWRQDRIEALLNGLIGGDGHTRADDGRRCFVQKDHEQCGLVQALAIRTGLSASVSGRPAGIGVVYLTKRRSRSFRGTAGQGSAPSRQLYTGVVWCPKLPRGTWVARRNGKVFITGNTFPPELAERCILAGTSEKGCCAACGAPWRRIVTKGEPDISHRAASGADASGGYNGQSTKDHDAHGVQNASDVKRRILEGMRLKEYDWQPGCSCNDAVVPCAVLDPFAGAFTTAMVADRLQRDAIGIELNSGYCAMAERRLRGDAGLFAEVSHG